MREEFPDIENDFISNFTVEQMLSQETFQMICDKDSAFDRERVANLCLVKCKELGINQNSFKKMLKEYKIKLANLKETPKGNKTKFSDQPIELNCGDWICDITGVKRNQMTASGNIEIKFASPIPILITEILKNIDEDNEKLKLLFFKEGWRSVICNRSTTASNAKIIELADKGIEVNSDNAKLLVRYIADLVSLNLDILPKYDAVSHLGWVEDEFIPYNENIKFDGEKEYKTAYDSVCCCGDFVKWIDYTSDLRKNMMLRLQMAASFASPLIEKVNALPFILHFWGGTGNGKTVGLMVAMSIWGNAKKGKIWRTLNNTVNYIMSLSAFFHNIPVGLDELQAIKQFNCSYDNLIMSITEGVDRGRMSYNKIEATKNWSCAYIFTGEEPITKDNSGGGAKNRVIEIECTESVINKNGSEIADFVQKNYGFAGKYFIKCIKGEDLKGQYKQLHDDILKSCDTTEKQAMAMALILLGDRLAIKHIYKNEKELSIDDIKGFLFTAEEVDVSERAYDFIIDYISINESKFGASDTSEHWGKFVNGFIYINKTVLERALESEGFSFGSVKSKWAEKGYLIKNSQDRFVHHTRCYGIKAMYIKLLNKHDVVEVDLDDLPFK